MKEEYEALEDLVSYYKEIGLLTDEEASKLKKEIELEKASKSIS